MRVIPPDVSNIHTFFMYRTLLGMERPKFIPSLRQPTLFMVMAHPRDEDATMARTGAGGAVMGRPLSAKSLPLRVQTGSNVSATSLPKRNQNGPKEPKPDRN